MPIRKLLIFALLFCVSCAKHSPSVDSLPERDASHPRLMWRKGEEEALKRNIASDIHWTRLNDALLSECENILPLENCTFEKDTRGTTHSQCCETVRRVLFLSYAYRITGQRRYFNKALDIVLGFCSLPNWNPYHFLDVAELTVAASIAYDWLYDDISPADRRTIVESIRDKALITSETGGEGNPSYNLRWMDMTSNWSQVCHGSLAMGAIAIYTEEPAIAKRIIERSSLKIFNPMNAEYPPMGAYSQGIGYWGYGTALNAMFIDSMQGFFGAESVSAHKTVPGFMQTGRYYSALLTNTLNAFSFSDNSTDLVLPEHCIFWFYKETADPQLLYHQAKLVDKFTDPSVDYKNGKPYSSKLVTGSYARHMPLMMIWGAGTGDKLTADLGGGVQPKELFNIFDGLNPLCVMRTGFDTDDIWLGFKAGNPSCAHGHMDVGEFMFEWGGARFGMDLGSDNYTKIGGLGLGSLFDMGPSALRWNSLMRYNNFSHSTLTVNGALQNLETKSSFVSSGSSPSNMFAVADLSPAYSGQLASATRKVSLIDSSRIEVEDELQALPDKEADVVWNFTTKAWDYSYDPLSQTITLSCKNGQLQDVTLRFKVEMTNPTALDVSFVPASSFIKYPQAETSADGINFLRLSFRLPAAQAQKLTVSISPAE